MHKKNEHKNGVLSGLRYKVLLGLLAGSFILSGCASGHSKKTIHIRIRSNRVEAQEARNQYGAITPTPLPAQDSVAPTPTSARAPVASAPVVRPTRPPQGSVAQPAPTPTPTPIPIPIGRPERIVIPSIDVDTPIKSVQAETNRAGNQWFQEWQTVAYAAGYHEGSALLGQKGNTVISGHNNIDGAVFRRLYEARPGEVVQVYVDGFRYDYIIEDQFIVREAGAPLEQRIQNASWIQTTVDERLTLVSCWPPTGNDYRVIVVAKPLSTSQQAASGDTGHATGG